jgi:hypothetical protein
MEEPVFETLVGSLHISDFRGYENVEFQQSLTLPPGSYNLYAHISESTGSEDSPSDESSLEEVNKTTYDDMDEFKEIIKELTECLEWYVKEDDVIEGDPENSYWLNGKQKL